MKPYYDNGVVQLYQTDAREIPLADQSVHCCVTSPPYFGLRVYADNDHRGIGLEASIEAYVANLVDVFREVKRVLRDDGVCWLNLGDSYAASTSTTGGYSDKSTLAGYTSEQTKGRQMSNAQESRHINTGIDAGNRLGIPERVVMALQADGWTWRDTVIWAKKSCMPKALAGWRWEKCRVKVANGQVVRRGDPTLTGITNNHHDDKGLAEWADCPGCPKCEANDGLVLRKGSWRTTSSHEYIFMLTKGMGYFADGEAVKTAGTGRRNDEFRRGGTYTNGRSAREEYKVGFGEEYVETPTANRRSVWNDISPEPYGGSHFATFPSDLPRICIQASTSEKGVCSECGSQWARVVERTAVQDNGRSEDASYTHMGGQYKRQLGGNYQKALDDNPTQTLDWRATCNCNAKVIPATVLDPFAGTFTTGYAAQKLGRTCRGHRHQRVLS
jgi:DNA modification methylase